MPLSDREQQILSEIESQLKSEDKKFVDRLNKGPLAKGRVSLRYAIGGIVLGLVMLLTIAINPWGPFVAFAGFVLMLVSAVAAGNQIRDMGAERSGPNLPGQIKGGFSRYLEGRRADGEQEE